LGERDARQVWPAARRAGSHHHRRHQDDCLTYTVAQAARLAGVSVSYYYRAAHQGLVPAKFLGRRIVVPKAALRRFLGDTEASGGDEAA